MLKKLLGIISEDFDATDRILRSANNWAKWEYNEAVYQLLINFKKFYGSVRTEVLYNILIEKLSPRNW